LAWLRAPNKWESIQFWIKVSYFIFFPPFCLSSGRRLRVFLYICDGKIKFPNAAFWCRFCCCYYFCKEIVQHLSFCLSSSKKKTKQSQLDLVEQNDGNFNFIYFIIGKFYANSNYNYFKIRVRVVAQWQRFRLGCSMTRVWILVVRQTNEPTNEWTIERMNEWTNERMNEWTNERMNEWTNERMNEWTNSKGKILSHPNHARC
jgi:hypothetical protein